MREIEKLDATPANDNASRSQGEIFAGELSARFAKVVEAYREAFGREIPRGSHLRASITRLDAGELRTFDPSPGELDEIVDSLENAIAVRAATRALSELAHFFEAAVLGIAAEDSGVITEQFHALYNRCMSPGSGRSIARSAMRLLWQETVCVASRCGGEHAIRDALEWAESRKEWQLVAMCVCALNDPTLAGKYLMKLYQILPTEEESLNRALLREEPYAARMLANHFPDHGYSKSIKQRTDAIAQKHTVPLRLTDPLNPLAYLSSSVRPDAPPSHFSLSERKAARARMYARIEQIRLEKERTSRRVSTDRIEGFAREVFSDAYRLTGHVFHA